MKFIQNISYYPSVFADWCVIKHLSLATANPPPLSRGDKLQCFLFIARGYAFLLGIICVYNPLAQLYTILLLSIKSAPATTYVFSSFLHQLSSIQVHIIDPFAKFFESAENFFSKKFFAYYIQATQKSPCTRQGLSFLFIHFKAILKIKYNAP